MWYIFFRACFRLLYRYGYRFQVIGQENVPTEGPVILCSNHISNLDPPLVGSSIDRQVKFMAKAELFKIPLLSFLLRKFGAFPVKRGGQDKQALRTALNTIKEGKVLGLFPEGTRSKTGELGQPFPGVGLIAIKEVATVIPIAIIGPYSFLKPVTIVFGKPINLEDLREEKPSKENINMVAERIMQEIQSLLDQHKIV